MLRLSITFYLTLFFTLLLFAQLVKAEQVKIITSVTPPFSFINQHQQLDGYAIDVVNRLQKTHSMKQEIQVKPWYQLYAELTQQANVVAFPVARTAERESLFHWIMPLSRNRHGLFATRDKKIKANNINDVERYGVIAVMRDDYRHHLLLKLGIKNIRVFDTWPQAIKAVLADQVTSIFMSEAGLSHSCQQQGVDCQSLELVFKHDISNSYVALSKQGTSKQVADIWLQAGEQLLKDKAFHNAARRWVRHYRHQNQQIMHFAAGALNLWQTQYKLDFMALYPQPVPVIYQHPESGEVKGIVPDILSGFSHKYGVEINYSFVNRLYSETALYEGKTGAILLSRSWAKHPGKLVFSDSLFEHRDYLLGTKAFELKGINNQRQPITICSRAQFVYPKLNPWFASGTALRLDTSSYSEILKLLDVGRCQYGVMGEYTAHWLKFNFADEISLYLSPKSLDMVPLTIALNRNNALLLTSLNAHITQLKKTGQLQEIIGRNIRVKLNFPRHSVLPAF